MLLCCQFYRRVTACWCRDLHLTCILGRQVRLLLRGSSRGPADSIAGYDKGPAVKRGRGLGAGGLTVSDVVHRLS